MQIVNGRLLIKPDEKKEHTQGGILIPEKHQDMPDSGEIILAPENSEFEKGQRIRYFSYAATNIKIGDDDLVVIPEKEVLLIE